MWSPQKYGLTAIRIAPWLSARSWLPTSAILPTSATYEVEISQLSYPSSGVDAWHQTLQVWNHRRGDGAWELVRRIISEHRMEKIDPRAVLTVVFEKVTEVMGSGRAAIRWLNRKSIALNGRRSVDQLDTPEGVDELMTLLGRIEAGIYL